jgi:beta-phosphoglucomutase-like phosphatase (HAD superfamily)
MFKALIFDFDGVIGDTYDMNFTLSRLFDPGITKQDFEDHHNGNVWAEPKIKISMEEVKILFEKQREIFTKKHLFPVKEILGRYSQDAKIFIISSSSEKNI